MLDKTVEQLKKELHNARASVSYHKNKNKPDKRQKGSRHKQKRIALQLTRRGTITKGLWRM